MNAFATLGRMLKLWGAVFICLCLPVGFFVLAGVIWLAQHSLLLVGCLVLVISWSLAFFLLRNQLSRRIRLEERPRELTARDQDAWRLIEEQERALEELTAEQLADRATHERMLKDLALRLARHYHPQAKDPLGAVTLSEVLVTARLAIDDAVSWLDYYVPGCDRLTVSHWRRLNQLRSPLAFVAKLAASGASRLGRRSRQEAAPESTISLHRVVLRKFGYYLIELYSGRQATRTLHNSRAPHSAPPGGTARRLETVTIAVVGEKNAGKTSLIRSLLGSDRASTDRLHSGAHVQRYRVQLDQPLARLVMLEMDLSGEHPTQRFQWITKGSDLVMFVSDVTQPDFGIPTALLERCRVAQVPMIVVLTHVDRMAAIEELKTRLGRKACSELDEAICRAVHEDRGRFGRDVTVVPLWADQDRGEMYGINQRLIPALAAVLTKAQSRVVLEAIAAPSCDSQVARAGKASSREQSV